MTIEATTTMRVYKDGHLLHFPEAHPRTQYTACGLDSLEYHMKQEDRPITWAGMWCSDCMSGKKTYEPDPKPIKKPKKKGK